MRIGVAGMGVVGSAVFNGLKDHYDVVGHDKKKDSDPFEALLETDVIFACLPTPTQMSGHGPVGLGTGQSLQAIYTFMTSLTQKKFRGIVVMKSTVIPGTCRRLNKEFEGITVVSNPEFLSAKTAKEDFLNEHKVIIGTDNMAAAEIVSGIYKKLGANKAFIVTPTEAETIKYMHNVFLAVKVATFNELYDVCRERKTNYEVCAKLACEVTGWINPRHTQVPGHDGMFGFGGECFPKDTQAFLCKYRELDLHVVEGALLSNKKRRKGASKAPVLNANEFRTIELNSPGNEVNERPRETNRRKTAKRNTQTKNS